MTYILGWKQDKTVYLIADSAITTEGIDTSPTLHKPPYTSFGELQILEHDFSVRERALKVFEIAGKLLLTYTGLVSEAHDVIEAIDKTFRLKANPNIISSINEILGSQAISDLAMFFFFRGRWRTKIVCI
jgi:hypothetical protein